MTGSMLQELGHGSLCSCDSRVHGAAVGDRHDVAEGDGQVPSTGWPIHSGSQRPRMVLVPPTRVVTAAVTAGQVPSGGAPWHQRSQHLRSTRSLYPPFVLPDWVRLICGTGGVLVRSARRVASS